MSLGSLQNEADLERWLRNQLQRPEMRKSIQAPNTGIWHHGTGVPATDLGKNGHYYLDQASKIVYVKASGAWI